MIIFGALVSILLVFPSTIAAQTSPQNTLIQKMQTNETGITVTAKIALQISNQTLKTKTDQLRGVIVNFLASAPNILKSQPSEQPIVKTKIVNLINGDTQNLEGVEATNAIVGVEITRALKTAVTNQSSLLPIDLSSTCRPTSNGIILCENSLTIKKQ